MAWAPGNQKFFPPDITNEELMILEGDLDEIEAKLTFAKFVRANIGFIWKFVSGKPMLPIQELIIRAILTRDNSLIVAGRGFGKSFLASILSLLMPILYPGSKGTLISVNFRRSRSIMDEAEKIVKSRKAALLQQCFTHDISRRPDICRWELPNGSEVCALPLSNGEGLRGTRSHWIVIDEGLLISKDIQENILRPFLMVKQDIDEEMKLRRMEDDLIKAGKMKETERMSSPKNKFIIFSSASYKFQYLYEMFNSYVQNCLASPSNDNRNRPSYFVMRASYEALPDNSLIDKSIPESAKASGGEGSDYFKREYKGLFSDASSSYFNVKMLHDCTLKAGEMPTTQVFGDRNTEYLLSIDTSYSASKGSDFFAMAVYMLVPEEKRIILVHSYGRAGGLLKEHHEYLTYLLTKFNIVFAIMDDSGSEFISGYNESTTAADAGTSLDFLECALDTEGEDYNREIAKMRQCYNLTTRKILYGQKSMSQPIRRMNEHLQNQINAGKVWFASPIGCDETMFKRMLGAFTPPYRFKDNFDQEYDISRMDEFLRDQDNWVNETKAQCALIEVRTTPMGHLQYDLPQGLSKSRENPRRPRKDHYTCLLLACYGAKVFYDMRVKSSEPEGAATFTPIMIGSGIE